MTERLTIGYVRDELRNLKRKSKTAEKNVPYYAVTKFIFERAMPHFDKGRKLSQSFADRLKLETRNRIESLFNIVFRHSYRTRLTGFEGQISTVETFFYLEASEHTLTDMQDAERVFSEDFVEVRTLRLVADRSKFVVDDISCNVHFSYHLLTRLIERGACVKEPVRCLLESLPDILFMVPIYTIGANAFGEITILIPFKDGLLIGDYMTRDTSKSSFSGPRMRYRIDRHGSDIRPLDIESPFEDNLGHAQSIRLTTYVSGDMMYADQRWVRKEVLALWDRYRDKRESMNAILCIPEAVNMSELSADLIPIFQDFKKLAKDPRWPIDA